MSQELMSRSGPQGATFRRSASSCLVRAALATLIALAGTTASVRAQPGVTDTIALSGAGGVPGVPGANFSSFSAPTLNAAGNVAFSGTLQTGIGGVTNLDNTGIWGPDTFGNLSLIAREGSGGVPGIAGASFALFDSLNLNDAGNVVFRATLTGMAGVTSSNNSGIWGPDALGNLSLIARSGSGGVPGVPGADFVQNTFFNPLINAVGSIVLHGTLQTGVGGVTNSNGVGIWGPDASGNLSLIARTGSSGVPGVPGADFINFLSVALNDVGNVAFRSQLEEGVGGVTTFNRSGIWGPDASGNLSLIARTGTGGVPGVPGANFNDFIGEVALNNAGNMAFIASLEPGPGSVNVSNNTGIWGPDTFGNLSLIAREGSGGVPGIAGASFSSFNRLVLNGDGNVAFFSQLVTGAGGVTSSNDAGIWGPDPFGNLTLIAREGSGGVPEIPGANFNFSSNVNLAINRVGNMVFLTTLQAGVGGVTASDNTGIWIGDGIELLEVARTGSSLTSGLETYITVDLSLALPPSGGEDGRRTSINDHGQVAYQALGFLESEFAFETGIFLWTPDLHWRATAADGQWDSRTNFTLSLDPAHVHRVFLDPAADTLIDGPAADTTVASLEIGGGAGSATLRLVSGVTLEAVDGATVLAGGTLSGSGTLEGDLLVSAGGTISPGNSPGPIWVIGDVEWGGGGILCFEINDALGIAGLGWDLLSIDGELDITADSGNPFVIDVQSLTLANAAGDADGFAPTQSYSWMLAATSGGISGFDPAAFLIDLGGFTNTFTGSFAVKEQAGSLYLQFTPVPEPSTLLLAFVGGCALLLSGHKRGAGFRFRALSNR